MKITTWNINGIRAAMSKGIDKWIMDFSPDVLCFQEIKAKPDQFDPSIFSSMGYQYVWNSAERPGYSGVGILFKEQPLAIQYGLGNPLFDKEGRVIQFSYPDFELFNIYFPNGGRTLERVPYKLDFYEVLLNKCDSLHSENKNIIITGDFNTAHNEIDLKNSKSNQKNTGFLPEERIWIDYYLKHGFVDIYRHLYPDRIQYTWWTYRMNARQNGVGWRLDYFLISQKLNEKVKDVIIHDDVKGSDHCPVTLQLTGLQK
jgi:exodeoxyribonuclease III